MSAPATVTWEEYGAEWEKASPFAGICLPSIFDADGSGVVSLSDFTAGVAWLVEPIPTSHLTGTYKAHIANMLAGAIARLPDRARLQIISCPTRNIEDSLDNYSSSGGSKHAMLAELQKSKANYYRNGVNGLGMRSGDLEFTVKSVRLMITLTIEATGTAAGILNSAKDALSKGSGSGARGFGRLEEPVMETDLNDIAGVARFANAYADIKKSLLLAAQTIESTFNGIKPAVAFRRATQDEFIRFFQAMVHVGSGTRSKAKWVPHEPLPEQLVRKEVRFTPDGYVLSDGYFHGVLTIDDYPIETNAGMLSEPHPNLGFNSLIDYVIDGVVCVNIFNPPREEIADWNAKKYKLANEGDGDPIERGAIIEESKLIRTWTKNEGRRMVDFQISVSMADKARHVVRSRLELVQAKLQEMGFRARIEESAAGTFWAHQLPFGWKPSMKGAKRVKRRVDLLVANLLPIYLMGRGTRSRRFMALNERGEPMGLDFFESRSAFNFAILGESGAGKSVCANALFADYARSDKIQEFIIDIGGSYRPLTNMVGDPDARMCELSRITKTALNCFDGTYSMASSFLLEWIPFLATAQGVELDPLVKGKIEDALRNTFRKKLKMKVPYVDPDKVFEDYPGYHIARMAKRINIKPLSEDQLKRLEEAKRALSNGADEPQFQIYYKIRIMGAMDAAGRTDRFTSVNELSGKEFLRMSQDYAAIEDDAEGVFVLTADPTAVKTLAFDGYECHVIKDYMVAEVAAAADFELLERFKVRVIMEEAYLQEARTSIRARLSREHGATADEGSIDRAIEREMEHLSGRDYFSRIQGSCDLQGTVYFREFAETCRESNDEDLNNLATKLQPYYGDGAYAGYFDRPTGFSLDGKRIVCWDFDDLMKGDTKLVGAMLGALFQYLVSHCTSPRYRGIRKIVFIDEYRKFQEASWIVDKFTDLVCRQGRKYGFAVGVGTQSINDLGKNARTNLLEHFQHLIIGVQKDQVVQSTRETLQFDSVKRARIMNMANRKGEWSEFMLFIENARIFEKMRIVLDPFLYWLFTTDDQDKDVREKLVEEYALQGYKPQQAIVTAIRKCVEKYPRGVAHFRKQQLK